MALKARNNPKETISIDSIAKTCSQSLTSLAFVQLDASQPRGPPYLYSVYDVYWVIFAREWEPSPVETIESSIIIFRVSSKIKSVLLVDKTQIERESSKEYSVSFLWKKLFKVFKSDFNDFDQVFFTAERLSCFEILSRQQSLKIIFRYIFHIIAKETTLSKGKFVYS